MKQKCNSKPNPFFCKGPTVKMGCKINPTSTRVLWSISTEKPRLRSSVVTLCSSSVNQNQGPISTAATPRTDVNFKTLGACKLAISRYPDFEYNADGGVGKGTATNSDLNPQVLASFDIESLYIPPLTSATAKFLGLPLPPFLKIDIVPEFFQGTINRETGKVDLEFKAKFLFSAGSVYRAPALQVETVLTTEESKGATKSGKGERLDKEGRCRLVGVATVEPIDDVLMNSFLGLPTECLADLNALISFPDSS